jgi:uncharacterized protein (TIGR02246 family)
MTTFRKLAGLLLLAALALPASSRAADEAAETQIRKGVDSYVEAFNRQDAKALAAHWAPEAVYVDDDSGEEFKGREAIEKYFARQFADAGKVKLEVAVTKVRFITADVASEEGQAKVTRPNKATSASNYVAIHVRQDGKWLIESVRETATGKRETQDEDAPAYERLQPLEWLLGRWVDEDENVQIETNCRWAKNRSFLSRSFRVVAGDDVDLEGTQIIGWDPVNQRIRSWVFDSDGGFGVGSWTPRKDGAWVVNQAATLADGRQTSVVTILKPIDANSHSLEMTGREVDGEILPNLPKVTVKRASD